MDDPTGGNTPALRTPATRRAVLLYGLRALGWVALGIAVVLPGTFLLTPGGQTKPGLPDFLPGVFFVPGFLAMLLGALSLLNVTRMAWVLGRHPWRRVTTNFEELEMSTPNGQPVFYLADGENRWTLTPASVKWRWPKFYLPQLLLAAPPGRGGVVATPDLRRLVWAGRSIFTRFMLRRRRGKR